MTEEQRKIAMTTTRITTTLNKHHMAFEMKLFSKTLSLLPKSNCGTSDTQAVGLNHIVRDECPYRNMWKTHI